MLVSERRSRAPASSAESTHGRRVSPAPSWPASPPRQRESAGSAAAGARRGSGLRLGRGDGARPGHRRRPHLHAEPPSPPARRGGARSGQARDLREAAGARRRGRAAARRRRGRLGPPGRRCRSSTGTTRRCARRASASAAGRPARCACCTAPICRTGSCAPTTTTGAWTSGWAAPRARSPTSARTGATWPSSSPAIASPALSARLLTAVPERIERGRAARRSNRTETAATRAPSRPRTPPSSSSRRTPERSARSSSARSRPAARTGSGSSSTAPRRRSPSTRSIPRSSGAGVARPLTIVRRDPATLSPAAARFAFLPAGHPQGYADCFDAFVADFYDGVRDGSAVDGMPTFADGLRAALITDAVLDLVARGALGRRGGDARDRERST